MNNADQTPSEQKHSGRKAFNWRGFFSLLLFLSFLVLAITGCVMYATPKGRVAHWTGWTVLGLDKEQWSAIHMTSALVVLIAAAFHLYYNWNIFWGYIKRRSQSALNLKREMALALLLAIFAVAGTIYNIPPFGTIVRWNEDIKLYWEIRSAAAPVPHAEEFTVAELAEEIGMPVDEVLARLQDSGITVDDPSAKIKDIAAANGMTPNELFDIVQPGAAAPGRGLGLGGGSGQGGGRGLGLGGGSGQGGGRGLGLGGGSGQGGGRGLGPGGGSGQGGGRGLGPGGGGRGQGGGGRGLGPGGGAGYPQ